MRRHRGLLRGADPGPSTAWPERHRARRRAPATAWVAVAVTALAVVASCSGEEDPGAGPDPAVTPSATATAVPAEEIPVPDDPRDAAVFDRLVAEGFTAAEANCLARRITLDDLVTAAAEELVEVFESCRVGAERLIEVGTAP